MSYFTESHIQPNDCGAKSVNNERGPSVTLGLTFPAVLPQQTYLRIICKQ